MIFFYPVVLEQKPVSGTCLDTLYILLGPEAVSASEAEK